MKRNLQTNSYRIDNILKDIFDETNLFMTYIGKQIAKKGKADDVNFIYNVLKSVSENKCKTNILFSWTFFDWVSPKNLQLVNHKQGINTSPPDMSHRDYTWKCRKQPWKLQVSTPAIGNPSGVWVIPAGTGITDNEGNFLGIIVVGFNINDLTVTLEEKFSSYKYSFIILDEDLNIILKSTDNIIDSNSNFYKNNIKKNLFKSLSGTLETPIVYDTIKYCFYKKMNHYPYIILMGYNTKVLNEELYASILPKFIETFCLGIFLLLSLYFYRQKLVNLNKVSNEARKKFLNHTNQKLRNNIEIIQKYSNIYLGYLKGELNININITKEKQIEFLDLIQEAALSLQNSATKTLHMAFLDVNKIIKDSIIIHSSVAFSKNISISSYLESELPLLYADEFCIKQIIVQLIAQSLEYSPNSSNIKIYTELIGKENDKVLKITIIDNSFGLSEQDLTRISEKFEANFIEETNLSMPTISELIRLHGGTCSIQCKWMEGRKVTIRIPVMKPPLPSIARSSEEESSKHKNKKTILKIIK